MYKIPAILTLVASLSVGSINGATVNKPQKSLCDANYVQLQNLYARFYEDLLEFAPEYATYVGSNTHNDRWTDYSEEGIAKRHAKILEYQEALLSFDCDSLFEDDKLTYALFEQMLDDSIREYHLKLRYLPVDQLGGIPLDIESTLFMMPRSTYQDYLNIISRLKALPGLLAQVKVLMEKGLEEGITHPQICLRSLPMRLQNLIPPTVMESPLYVPFKSIPDPFSLDDVIKLQEEAQQALCNDVYPAYQSLLQYVTDIYLPGCRTSIGMSDIPNGLECYHFMVRSNTTTELTPTQIHELGLKEVKRIRAEMQSIMDELGFEGTRQEFMHILHHTPEFFYSDAQELVDGYREITRFIDQQLPSIFGKLPKLPYEVVPVPAHSEQNQVGAYYMPGSPSAGRPGRFYVNTFDLSSRPKWAMESLALHEAVPGHHFQISIAQEMENVPEFRKHTRYTAYVEGWALYCEGIGEELGLYKSLYSKFGRHVEEIWRAVRLVVDTGMHALGWSREKAIAYFMEQTGIGEREATTEIDRYLVWPGQALAYKVGELCIKKWRHEAEKELGENFDIRSFHDELLCRGALPMGLCDKIMKAWVAGQKE